MTSNNRKRDHEDITGRDAFVVAAALWTFIRYEQSAPIRERRWSDMLDAVTILKALYPGFIRVFELKDELKGLRPVELDEAKLETMDAGPLRVVANPEPPTERT